MALAAPGIEEKGWADNAGVARSYTEAQLAGQTSMDTVPDISALIRQFLSAYDARAKDEVWRGLSERFKAFWRQRVLSEDSRPISDIDCDEVIRILDRNGKGNTKESEAVAKAMIAQGAYRRMFNEFHVTNRPLGALVDRVLTETDSTHKTALIDALYEKNAGQRNHLTGQSGNAVGMTPFVKVAVARNSVRPVISIALLGTQTAG